MTIDHESGRPGKRPSFFLPPDAEVARLLALSPCAGIDLRQRDQSGAVPSRLDATNQLLSPWVKQDSGLEWMQVASGLQFPLHGMTCAVLRGEPYRYEAGEHATVALAWDDARRTQRMGSRAGGFPEMTARPWNRSCCALKTIEDSHAH